jgi:hypothetical protein
MVLGNCISCVQDACPIRDIPMFCHTMNLFVGAVKNLVLKSLEFGLPSGQKT